MHKGWSESSARTYFDNIFLCFNGFMFLSYWERLISKVVKLLTICAVLRSKNIFWQYTAFEILSCRRLSSLQLVAFIAFLTYLSYKSNMVKQFRYTYPWWREKEIISESKRLQGLCPLTPEETSLILQALGFERNTRIYIASGEIYGGNRRLAVLRDSFPRLVRYCFCSYCHTWLMDANFMMTKY